MHRNPRVALLFAQINTLSVTTTPKCRSFPIPSHTSIVPRSFSSSSRFSTESGNEAPAWADIRETVRPSAMWLAPAGSKLDQQQILDQLPKLNDKDREELPVVLLLVTPKLAHLFENDHTLHSKVVNTIYGEAAKSTLRQSIVAVVDALPVLGKFRGAAKPEIHGAEGIALCISPGFDVQPATDRDNRQPLISMTARNPFFDGRRYVTFSWSGGVANTTFINGRQHTLFMQNWRNRDGEKWLPESKRHSLRHVDVQAYTLRRDSSNYLSVVLYSNMIKLTDPKVILSSMGNIVRRVQSPGGEKLAASHELETIVPKMLKQLQKTTPTGDLRVFALVYPPEIGDKDPFKDCIWDNNVKQTETRMRKYNINLLTLLLKGARLYRVTSGGAGWGNKAGLLSLEPITELGGSDVEPEFPSFIFEQTEDIRMPGSADLFPPGYVVQFIGTFHDAEGLKKDAIPEGQVERVAPRSSKKGPDWTDPDGLQQFCLGTTVLPETHQYTSIEDVDRSSMSDTFPNESTSQSLIFRANRFGFLTTAALGLSTRFHSPSPHIQDLMTYGGPKLAIPQVDTSYRHSSLIELPNSYFLTKFAAGGVVVKEAAKYYTGSESSIEPRTSVSIASLARELSEEESASLVSQRLRDAERLQKDSYKARKQTFTRKVAVRSEKVTRLVDAELSPITKFESQRSHEAITRYIRTRNDVIDASIGIVTRELIALRSLSLGQSKKMRRYMEYRSTGLLEGKPVKLGVVSDATWRGVDPPQHAAGIRPPFRWTRSDMPEGLSEIFTNESSGSEDRRIEVDEEQEYLRELKQAHPDNIIRFKPIEPEPRIRPVVSISSKAKTDISSIVQQSAIFRTYSRAEFDEPDFEERVKINKERKIIEALTTDL